MLQPNDLSMWSYRDENMLLYLSGQNYTANTTAGESGDLWTCSKDKAIQFPPAILKEAGIHRTNGIEVSLDGKTLYLSSAKNENGNVTENAIYAFQIGVQGELVQEKPKLFYNFTGDQAAIDVDGMRTDLDGNLYVTRNGDGKVNVFGTDGTLKKVIDLPGVKGPSNLELGGPGGTTLYAVGKCKDHEGLGCAASFETGIVGKAYKALQV